MEILSGSAQPVGKKGIAVVLVASITLALALLMFHSIFGQSTPKTPIGSLGTVKAIGIGVYWDSNCSNVVSSIDWGTIWPGSSKNVTFYLQSISNIETTLYLNATDWDPANISNYMSLSWNYNGTPLNPGEIIQVTMTLSASSSDPFIRYLIANDVKDFGLIIIISCNA